MASRTCVPIVLAIVSMVNCTSSTARGQELHEDVVEALRRNAAALSPVTVSWELKRSSYLSLDEFPRYLKMRDDSKAMLIFPEQVTMSYQHGKLFHSRKKNYLSNGSTQPFHQEVAFDGETAYFANRIHVPLVVSIWDAKYRNTRYPKNYAFNAEYFAAAGFKIHEQMDSLDRPPESLLLYLTDNGGRISDCQGVAAESSECLSVEVAANDGRHVFVLDPAKGYVMLRHQHFDQRDRLIQTTVNEQFVELSERNLWLPKRCVVADYTFPEMEGGVSTNPIITSNIAITEVNRKVWPDERFVIEDREPGAIVGDSRAAAAGEPGAVLNKEDGRYRYQIPVEVGRARTMSIWWLGGTLAVLLILAVLTYRRWRGYGHAN